MIKMIDKNKMKIVTELLEAVNGFNGSRFSKYIADFNLFNGDELRISFMYRSDTICGFLNWHMKLKDLDIGGLAKCAARIKKDMNRLKEGVSMSNIVCELPTDCTRVDVNKYVERY